MRREVINWLEEQNYQASKIIARKPSYLTTAQVKAGIEAAYDKYSNHKNKRSQAIVYGEEFKTLTLVPLIYQEAGNVVYDEFLNDEEILNESKEIIKTLKHQRFILVLGLLVILLFEVFRWAGQYYQLF